MIGGWRDLSNMRVRMKLTIIRKNPILPLLLCDATQKGAEPAVYVCICNGYRDSDLRHVIKQGARTVEQAYEALGCEPRCGQCLQTARDVFDEVVMQLQGHATTQTAPRALMSDSHSDKDEQVSSAA